MRSAPIGSGLAAGGRGLGAVAAIGAGAGFASPGDLADLLMATALPAGGWLDDVALLVAAVRHPSMPEG